jgi:hypothetical protein
MGFCSPICYGEVMSILRAALTLLALTLAVPPVAAQQAAPQDGTEEGTDLIQRGIQSILDGLFQQMQPAIQDMAQALDEIRPMAEQLLKLVDDIGNYEAPVVLENGDILIRRKPKVPEPPKEGEIDL